MSSLILITGTIDQAEDPFHRLDFNQLYYETWKDDIDTSEIWKETESVPVKYYSSDVFRLVQQKGSGKTLKAMDILSQKAFYGGNVMANLGLVWHNQNEPNKKKWEAKINNVDDFMKLNHCTALIDDVALWIKKWNTSQASILAEISAAGRKSGIDMICTSQRENQIPPEIRDQATEWIVPIIRVRDERTGSLNPDDNTGRPMELVTLHFDGAKVFKFMSLPLINLEPLMNCYSTVEKSINLSDGIKTDDSLLTSQPGREMEVKLYQYIKGLHPNTPVKLGTGKGTMDIETPNAFIDHKGITHTGKESRLNMKTLLDEHKDYCELHQTKGYVAYWWKDDFKFINIKSKYLHRLNPTITPAFLAASRSHKSIFG